MISTFMLSGAIFITIEQLCFSVRIEPFPVVDVTENETVTLICNLSPGETCPVVWQTNPPRGILFTDCTGIQRQEECNSHGSIDSTNITVSCDRDSISLTIKNVSRKENDVFWVCEPMIVGFGKSTKFYVKVPVSTASLNATGNLTRRENSILYIKCSTSGARPASKISWWIRDTDLNTRQLHVDRNVTETENDSENLTVVYNTIAIILNRTVNRFTVYCSAHNLLDVTEVNSSEVILNVTYPPNVPRLNVNGRTIEVIENKPLDLECYVDGGNPPPEVNWTCYKAHQTTHLSTATTLLTVSAILTIKATKGETNTSCRCVSTFLNGTNSAEVLISVLYPPTAPTFNINDTKYVTEASIIQSRTVTIACTTDSYPTSKFSWMKFGDGSILANSSNFFLKNITSSMRGDYICQVNNKLVPSLGATELGSNNSSFRLDVLYPPRIRNNITSTTVIEGRSVEIECLIDVGNPARHNVSWKNERDGRVWNSSLLRLPFVRRNDSSNYTCHVRNTMEQTIGPSEEGHDSKTFRIDVKYMPVITDFHVNSYVNQTTLELNETDSATFICSVDSNPGSMVTLSNSTEVVHKTRSTVLNYLHRNITCWDSDTYACMANNGIDSGNRSENIRKLLLMVNCFPRPFNGGSKDAMTLKNISSKLGESATLSLQVVGHPTPIGQWYKLEKENTREIQNDHKTIMTNESKLSRHEFMLEITNILPDDFGQYQLQLKNRFGMLTQSFRLFADGDVSVPGGSSSLASGIGGGLGSIVAGAVVCFVGIFFFKRRRQQTLLSTSCDNTVKAKDDVVSSNVYESLDAQSVPADQYQEISKVHVRVRGGSVIFNCEDRNVYENLQLSTTTRPSEPFALKTQR